MEMMLSARRVPAQEALEMGLISRVVPAADLQQETLALAEVLANKPPVAVRLGKAAFRSAPESSVPARWRPCRRSCPSSTAARTPARASVPSSRSESRSGRVARVRTRNSALKLARGFGRTSLPLLKASVGGPPEAPPTADAVSSTTPARPRHNGAGRA